MVSTNIVKSSAVVVYDSTIICSSISSIHQKKIPHVDIRDFFIYDFLNHVCTSLFSSPPLIFISQGILLHLHSLKLIQHTDSST